MAESGSGKAAAWMHYHEDYGADFCLIFPFCRIPNGYGMFSHEGKRHYAHRFMCELANGPPPSDEHEAAHSCGNGDGGCCNPRHLSWKTRSENRIDALKHGTGVRGSYGKGRLSAEQVMAIRDLKGRKTQAEIAEQFDISEPRVRAIFTGKIYKGNSKIDYWKPEEDQIIRDGVARGLDFTQLSALIPGRAKSAVSMRTYRLGLKSGRPPDPKRDKSTSCSPA